MHVFAVSAMFTSPHVMQNLYEPIETVNIASFVVMRNTRCACSYKFPVKGSEVEVWQCCPAATQQHLKSLAVPRLPAAYRLVYFAHELCVLSDPTIIPAYRRSLSDRRIVAGVEYDVLLYGNKYYTPVRMGVLYC